jgi:hypothetical protein
MKWIFRWLFRLLFAAVALMIVAIVILLLSYNSILRGFVEHQIRNTTGMDTKIGKLSIDLLTPTVTVENFKLYNTPDFGGTPFLSIPEIHVEYDRVALARREIHVTLMRFNLGEFDIVKNESGRTNFFPLNITLPAKQFRDGKAMAIFKRQTGYDFKGIDVLNVSIGKVRFIDLKNQQNNREQDIGIENCIMKNVQSPADLAGLGALIWLRSDHMVGLSVAQPQPGQGTNSP